MTVLASLPAAAQAQQSARASVQLQVTVVAPAIIASPELVAGVQAALDTTGDALTEPQPGPHGGLPGELQQVALAARAPGAIAPAPTSRPEVARTAENGTARHDISIQTGEAIVAMRVWAAEKSN